MPPSVCILIAWSYEQLPSVITKGGTGVWITRAFLLALLVCARTFELLGLAPSGILAVTMPGFGTTPRTLESARRLAAAAGAELREIDIPAEHIPAMLHKGRELIPAIQHTVTRGVGAAARPMPRSGASSNSAS